MFGPFGPKVALLLRNRNAESPSSPVHNQRPELRNQQVAKLEPCEIDVLSGARTDRSQPILRSVSLLRSNRTTSCLAPLGQKRGTRIEVSRIATSEVMKNRSPKHRQIGNPPWPCALMVWCKGPITTPARGVGLESPLPGAKAILPHLPRGGGKRAFAPVCRTRMRTETERSSNSRALAVRFYPTSLAGVVSGPVHQSAERDCRTRLNKVPIRARAAHCDSCASYRPNPCFSGISIRCTCSAACVFVSFFRTWDRGNLAGT